VILPLRPWRRIWLLVALGLVGVALLPVAVSVAQDITPEMLKEASRRTGMSEEELLRRYQANRSAESAAADTTYVTEPGRTSLDGIDDRYPAGTDPAAAGQALGVGREEARYWLNAPEVLLPYERQLRPELTDAQIDSMLQSVAVEVDTLQYFGSDFFRLDRGVFAPPSFGPVPDDYRLGVGDQLVIDVWGEAEFRIARIVDRDGTVILPEAGKIVCQDRTLAQVRQSILDRLARSHAGLAADSGDLHLEVSLGSLRSIRIFVVGEAVQPGSFEVSSVATVFGALYAAGGPAATGSMRDIRLVRADEVIAHLDVYDYLLGGRRTGDKLLREGDTVYVRERGPTIELRGEIRRSMLFELKPGEGIDDLLRFAGGFTAQAVSDVVRVERIIPRHLRLPESSDRVIVDIQLDPVTGEARDLEEGVLYDGDVVIVDAVEDRLDNWVEIQGNVKHPGLYEYESELDVGALIDRAGGLWPDTLEERALIDRTDAQLRYSAFSFHLGDVLAGRAQPVLLQPRDVVQVFSRWDVQDRYEVHIDGEVRAPLSVDYRAGMTLRDLVLKAGGLKQSADPLRAEISRVKREAVESLDVNTVPAQTVEIIMIDMGYDYLVQTQSVVLQPHDRVVVRRLPWWELQRTVELYGEVYFSGTYSLERSDEKLSSVIARAGGLKPNAYPGGARVVRQQDGVGNIAIDLERALADPGSQYDIVLQEGDEVIIPDRQYTVKVAGEIGFPTSLIWEKGRKIDYYVDRAGGYLENADKNKTRVVHPNGLSLPNKGGSKVVAGSTIIVPVKPPPEGANSLEVLKDIVLILGSLATVWLAIDRGTN